MFSAILLAGVLVLANVTEYLVTVRRVSHKEALSIIVGRVFPFCYGPPPLGFSRKSQRHPTFGALRWYLIALPWFLWRSHGQWRTHCIGLGLGLYRSGFVIRVEAYTRCR